MSALSKSVLAAGLLGLAVAAQATPTVTVVANTAGVTNALAAADAFVPANSTPWQTTSAWWTGNAETITFQLDQAYFLSSAVITADWNDVYRFSASTDGVNFTQLFTVTGLADQPVNANVTFGQVTMPVSFAPTALAYSYIRVQAIAGDGSNAIGEVSFSGVAAPVPEPGTLAFMAAGVGILGFVARRRRRG
ncbi:MAG: PEP-CTERM sorting domain-containing protein [Pelomonas sp.]|nr:PEP-CTERM sorting domain-containing protein [Roseateles sp.]